MTRPVLRIAALTTQREIRFLNRLEETNDEAFVWFWADMSEPTDSETRLLDTFFHFHPLAVEDCLHLLQRPKLDHYEGFHFFVLHAIDPRQLGVEEVNLFLTGRYMVTYHSLPSKAVDEAWAKLAQHPASFSKGPVYAAYAVMDKLVDHYFPAVYELEDLIADIDAADRRGRSKQVMDDVFDIRSRLLKLRRTIVPMRELLYRVINSERIAGAREYHAFYTDVHDHLLKLSEMIESNRDLTADIRDSYLSYNSDRMNTIMKTLTVITTIFMPLTFIAGVYGMNFIYMPELQWRWGYFAVLAAMIAVGLGMFAWFKRKGWFD